MIGTAKAFAILGAMLGAYGIACCINLAFEHGRMLVRAFRFRRYHSTHKNHVQHRH